MRRIRVIHDLVITGAKVILFGGSFQPRCFMVIEQRCLHRVESVTDQSVVYLVGQPRQRQRHVGKTYRSPHRRILINQPQKIFFPSDESRKNDRWWKNVLNS